MEYLIHLGILIAIYVILGISLNLVVGYTGLLSMAQAAFYGIGAYTTAIFLVSFKFNFFLSVIAGIIITAVLSLIIGLVLSKFNNDYYVFGSFGFTVIIYSVLLNWQKLTRGPLGISGIKRPEIFGFSFDQNIHFLLLVVVVAILVYFLARFITGSSFGRVLKAIREDEKAIQVFGYNTLYFKLMIFIIGACLASVAGSFFASYISYVSPLSFSLAESVFILAIIIMGGLANNKGTVIGAIFLIILPEILRFVGFPNNVAAQMRQATYGLILILLMLYRPHGFMGEYRL